MTDSTGGTAAGSDETNPDWDRQIGPEEAQKTAADADPDDLGSTAPDDPGMTAGGEGTAVRSETDTGGGTPLTHGYVTGGAHHANIEDLARESENE